MATPTDYRYLDNINIGIQVISPDMTYLFVNQALLSELNLSERDIVGYAMHEKFPGIERTDVYEKIKQCIESGKDQSLVNEFVYEGKSRKFYDLRMHPVPEGAIVFTTDVTDSKQGEKLLQESNELLEEKVRMKTLELEEKNAQLEVSRGFYRSILETLPFGMHAFTLNEAGELIFEDANQAADDILGIHHAPLFGKTIHQAFPNIESTGIPEKFKAIAEQGGNYHEINIHYEDDRYQGTFENFNFQVADNKVMSFFRDITQQKQLEDTLRQKQKMEAMGVMTGGVAHEFNNLLLPVMGFAEMLYAQSSDADTREKLQNIIHASERASKLIKSMLAFSRQSQEPKKAISLAAVIESTVSFIASTLPKNVAIHTQLADSEGRVSGVSDELQQALLNLILNASHAMPQGGDILIQLGDAVLNPGLNQHFIELKVQDSGEGIAHGIIDKIFDPFFTTKETGRGTGLGLSVVQGVVEQHNGHIRVSSEAGMGTTFSLYFPALLEDCGPSEQPAPPGDERVGAGSILVLDDERAIVDLLKQNLTEAGYQVRGFTDCEQAISAFSDAPDDFDLVLLDFGMPHMSGKDVAETLINKRPDAKIVLMTGYGKLMVEEDVNAWGIRKSILKPFKMTDMRELIAEVLANGHSAQQGN